MIAPFAGTRSVAAWTRSLLPLALALSAAGAPPAQDCVTTSPTRTLSAPDPWQLSFFFGAPCIPQNCQLPPNYTGVGLLCDLQSAHALQFPRIDTALLHDRSTYTSFQLGNRGQVRAWSCAGSWANVAQLAPGSPGSPWTLLGTGEITVEHPDAASPIVFSPPLQLPAGSHGLLLELQPTTIAYRSANVNPGPLHPIGGHLATTGSQDWYLQTSQPAIQISAFVSAPLGNNPACLRFHYQPPTNVARWQPTGPGCYDEPAGFHESFDDPFDLGGTSQRWTMLGQQYHIGAGTAQYVPPSSPSLTNGPPGTAPFGTWDDALSVPIALPAPFPYPGGPAGGTHTITIASEGRLFLAAATDFEDCLPFVHSSRLEQGPPCLAVCYGNLNPHAGGIHFETDGATWVRITWAAVPEAANSSNPLTFQATLHLGSGDIDLVYPPSTLPTHRTMWGFTPGQGQAFAPELDVSTSLPWTSNRGVSIPRLDLDAPPSLGSSFHLVTDTLHAGTSAVLTGVAFHSLPGGLALAPYGAPGCAIHLAAFDWLHVLAVGGSGLASAPFVVPNDPRLAGLPLHAQSLALSPGFNTAGWLVSNGLCFAIW